VTPATPPPAPTKSTAAGTAAVLAAVAATATDLEQQILDPYLLKSVDMTVDVNPNVVYIYL
jgi:hypothetical protein